MNRRLVMICVLLAACSTESVDSGGATGPDAALGAGDISADAGGTSTPRMDTASSVDASPSPDASVPPADVPQAQDTAQAQDVPPPPEDIPPPPEEPTLIQANTTWEVSAELLMEGSYTFAWDPTGAELVLQGADGAVYFAPPGQITPPLDATPGALEQGVVVSAGELDVPVVLTDEGLFVRFEDALVRSPIDDLLPSVPEELLASTDPIAGWLWMALGEGLWVHHGDAVYAVEPEGIDTGSARLAFGAPVAGFPSLWGVNSAGTWALSPSDESLTLSAQRAELIGVDIAADEDERLWVVDDAGDLHERAPNGTWDWWRLPSEVSRVLAGRETGGLWLVVGDELWFHYEAGYGPLETALTGALMGIDPSGRALVINAEGLWAIALVDLANVEIEEPPTWSGDIHAISIDACEACHGKGAYAHPLYEPEHWIAEIDEIIYMVSEPPWEPQMPLPPNPPLDNDAVKAIMDWRDAGFPE